MIQLLTSNVSLGKIGYLELDAVLSETHEYSNDLTRYPVEKGFNISDHIIRIPEKLTIEGFMTNTPIYKHEVTQDNRVIFALNSFLDMAGYSQAQYVNSQQELYKNAYPIDVITNLRIYKNMIITRLSIPRDKDFSLNSMKFTIDMERLITVENTTTIVKNTSELNGKAPNAATKTADNVPKKQQTTTEADAKQASALQQLLDAATAAIKAKG